MEEITITALIPDNEGVRRYGDVEKLLIFSKALEFLPHNRGLCGAIENALYELDPTYKDYGYNDPYFNMRKAFPEIDKYKPKTHESYWFGDNTKGSPGYKKRVKILKAEIKILKQKLNK